MAPSDHQLWASNNSKTIVASFHATTISLPLNRIQTLCHAKCSPGESLENKDLTTHAHCLAKYTVMYKGCTVRHCPASPITCHTWAANSGYTRLSHPRRSLHCSEVHGRILHVSTLQLQEAQGSSVECHNTQAHHFFFSNEFFQPLKSRVRK